jgi:hypothetical protein
MHDLLTRSFTTTENWLSATGQSTEYSHRLGPPFSQRRRVARQRHLTAVGE